MPSDFSFRLNGQTVPFVFIERERVSGKLTGRRHVDVYVDGIGRFTIDDDDQPWEEKFSDSVLEYRNDTENENAGENEGWRRVTPSELLQVLVNAGVIDNE
jgi:hypothetical protein